MAGSKLTPADIERAIALREGGMTLNKIGALVGVSGKALSWHFLKRAVDPPKPYALRPDYHLVCPKMERVGADGKVHVVRAFTPEEDARITALSLEGLNHTDIGRAVGRKPNSVHGRLMTLARRAERELAA